MRSATSPTSSVPASPSKEFASVATRQKYWKNQRARQNRKRKLAQSRDLRQFVVNTNVYRGGREASKERGDAEPVCAANGKRPLQADYGSDIDYEADPQVVERKQRVFSLLRHTNHIGIDGSVTLEKSTIREVDVEDEAFQKLLASLDKVTSSKTIE